MLSASANAILQLLFIAAFPLASVELVALDVLVIYGVVAHGHKPAGGVIRQHRLLR